MSIISAKGLERNFDKLKVIRGIDLDLEQEGQYAVVGASGSGKSTLLYMLGGLDRPTSGNILVDTTDITKLNDQALAAYRNKKVGFVFQNHFLLGSMNCEDNILLPARIGGENLSEIKKRIRNIAKQIGVEHCLKKYPYEISGGEGQRVNIVRALSLRPKLLLCDEPTGNLDSKNTRIVIDLLRSLASDLAATLIVVTHDQSVANGFAQKIELQDGQLLQ